MKWGKRIFLRFLKNLQIVPDVARRFHLGFVWAQMTIKQPHPVHSALLISQTISRRQERKSRYYKVALLFLQAELIIFY